ncbi:helix-turn-helix domain-containing protein [Micromonospora sp. WMMD1082]|uniref:helix-turn-helix domain-containing protein n=1 Tax=Micromonospora sp. WMMD1082 TaxID=3016104 RepID=UPI0024169AF5|nr:helix-turn-helix domain-containing protein [Micromonospora sp. WMMD1082]MDG4796556.1 helix-turn-helix domain-containing protein [Micromonospora sp. WMMD1082]
MTSRGELPIGRRVAQWRARRRMTQQALADRLGKSKSWVDKVERGARRLDKFSVIQQIAEVLRVDPAVLLGQQSPAPAGGSARDGLDGVRAAMAGVFRASERPVGLGELRRHVGHAWLTYQHARYPQVVRALPGMLDAAQGLSAAAPPLLVQVYRIASSVLVKLGEADLAWLAADRAVAAAGGDRVLAGTAAVSIGSALRAAGRERLALAATVAAAGRLVPVPGGTARPVGPSGRPVGLGGRPVGLGGRAVGPSGRVRLGGVGLSGRAPGGTVGLGGTVGSGGLLEESAVGGTLLLQAAFAAATCGEVGQAGVLLDRAAEVAQGFDAGEDPHRTCFGSVVVELARVVVAVEGGDAVEAVCRHEVVMRRDGWRRLPAEYRGAYLMDAARAYLLAGDLAGAGRMLVAADSVAPAEVRSRPSARTLLAEIARGRPAPAGVARLATLVGLTR